MAETNTTALITTGKNEMMKRYFEYLSDGTDRLHKTYEAGIATPHQGPCLVTEIKYVGATSLIQATKESSGSWDSSYEV